MDTVTAIKSISFLIVAGLFEIGGGYLIWLWIREGKPLWYALAGAMALAIYGVIHTFQPTDFGRAYAAYGGIFIAMAILWGWQVDRVTPDRFDLIGGGVALIGVGIIMYWPRP